MPGPFRDIFSDFPEILRSRNCDLETANNTFWGCHGHFYLKPCQPFSKQLYSFSSLSALRGSVIVLLCNKLYMKLILLALKLTYLPRRQVYCHKIFS